MEYELGTQKKVLKATRSSSSEGRLSRLHWSWLLVGSGHLRKAVLFLVVVVLVNRREEGSFRQKCSVLGHKLWPGSDTLSSFFKSPSNPLSSFFSYCKKVHRPPETSSAAEAAIGVPSPLQKENLMKWIFIAM